MRRGNCSGLDRAVAKGAGDQRAQPEIPQGLPHRRRIGSVCRRAAARSGSCGKAAIRLLVVDHADGVLQIAQREAITADIGEAGGAAVTVMALLIRRHRAGIAGIGIRPSRQRAANAERAGGGNISFCEISLSPSADRNAQAARAPDCRPRAAAPRAKRVRRRRPHRPAEVRSAARPLLPRTVPASGRSK